MKHLPKTTNSHPKTHQKSIKNQPKNNQKIINKPSSIRQKSITNPSKIIPEASRREIGNMVGSRNLSGSCPIEFLVDFWRHLGPCWTLNGSQDDAKIIQKSMPKSFKNLLLLVKAPRRPKTTTRRPQDGPRDSNNRKMEPKWNQFGIKNDSKFDLMSK